MFMEPMKFSFKQWLVINKLLKMFGLVIGILVNGIIIEIMVIGIMVRHM